MKTRALLAVTLHAVLVSGCASINRSGPETTILGYQKERSFDSRKVALLFPIAVEKDMETKKTPDSTEKAVGDEVYAALRENLTQKGILAQEGIDNIRIDLHVHYVNSLLGGWSGGYFENSLTRVAGGQILVVQVLLRKKDELTIAKITSKDNTGTLRDRKPIVQAISTELAAQIEKILKEGIAVGKTQSP